MLEETLRDHNPIRPIEEIPGTYPDQINVAEKIWILERNLDNPEDYYVRLSSQRLAKTITQRHRTTRETRKKMAVDPGRFEPLYLTQEAKKRTTKADLPEDMAHVFGLLMAGHIPGTKKACGALLRIYNNYKNAYGAKDKDKFTKLWYVLNEKRLHQGGPEPTFEEVLESLPEDLRARVRETLAALQPEVPEPAG